jgi:hypothetical protein
MKTLFTTLLIAAFAVVASAQQHTLFNGNARVTGFGGPGVYYTQFNGKPQVMVGGSGAVLVNSTVYLGGAIYGMASEPDAGMAMIDGQMRDTHFENGYCGGLLGMILQSNDVLHASADVLVGGGTISQVRDHKSTDHESEWNTAHEDDDFFMVQPMAHLELNAFRWMRVDAGAGYRFVNGITRFGLENKDVSGPVAGLGFRFGKF